MFEETVQRLMENYKQNEEARNEYVTGRFKDIYKKYTNYALKKAQEKFGDESSPVLIGKHFGWLLISEAGKYGINVANFFDIFISHNPQKPGEQFLMEYGDLVNDMRKELSDIIDKSKSEAGAIDYIIWLHQKSEKNKRSQRWHTYVYIWSKGIKKSRGQF